MDCNLSIFRKGFVVQLERLGKKHLHETWRWMRDPRITSPFGRSDKLTWHAHVRWFHATEQDQKQAIFAIVALPRKEHIGNIGLKNIDPKHRSGELWIYIGNHAYHRKGMAMAAMKILIPHAFNTLRLHRLQARIFENNSASLRLFKKCGFREEGKLKDAFVYQNKFQTLRLLSLIENSQ